jgi:5'(3')-deoxyribonucleotidase
MKRIAIDMDDVMADTTVKIIQTINDVTNSTYTYDALMSDDVKLKQDFYNVYLENNSFLWQPGFFTDLPVKEGAIEVIKNLTTSYEIFIVSAATEFPNSLSEKLEWMKMHFPFITWHNIVFCGHKHMIQADYLIDDHERNLVTFTGTPLLFSAPHNLHINSYERVNSWLDVKDKFL